MSKYTRFWRRNGDPLTDHLVCPSCGENASDREGKPRLKCECSDGSCFAWEPPGKLTWRRSPCPHAKCDACGWHGSLKSHDFEHVYHRSRCPGTVDGWHDVAATVYRNDTPSPITIELRCKVCGTVGHKTINVVDEVAWSDEESDEK